MTIVGKKVTLRGSHRRNGRTASIKAVEAIKEDTTIYRFGDGALSAAMKKVGYGRPGKQDTTPLGGVSIEREIDAGIEGSWIRRAGNEPAPSACADDECRSVVALPLALAKADRGWDPREVWLRRIHEPRRCRGEDGFQPLSDASPATARASDAVRNTLTITARTST